MRDLARVAVAFLRRDLQRLHLPGWILGWLNSGLLVLFWHFLTRFVQVVPAMDLHAKSDYFTFSLIGLAVTQYVWTGFASFANQVRQQQATGALESLWVTAYPFPLLVGLSGCWSFVTATINAGVILGMGIGLGARMDVGGAVGVLVVGLLISLAMGALGLMDVSWSILSGRGSAIRPLLSQAMPFFSGAFFPIALFPGWVQWVAWSFPLSHALTLARGALMPAAGPGATGSWAALVGMTAVLTVLGWWVLALAVRQGRINGRLAAS